MLGIITIVTLVLCAQALPSNYVLPQKQNPIKYFDTVDRIAQDGYYAEAHTVTTSDGYILEINRIPFGRDEHRDNNTGIAKPIVFLMHGLQSSAISFITLRADKSLAYLLADEGYDVWMGNARGVMNSRRHVSLDPDSDVHKFFDYTFEDIGMKDLPAMIDYVLEVTGKTQLHYIGHSQGGTTFLVLNSMFPEYQEKFTSAHLLAGVGYQNNFPNRILRVISATTDPLYAFALRVGFIELLGPSWGDIFIGECSEENPAVCAFEIIGEVMGDALGPLESLAGSSIKQYAHYGQNIKDKRFRRWNYNLLTNWRKYRRFSPPEFDISKINVECTMHYTVGNILLDEQDVLDMAKVMPNTKARKVARESYTHFDFVIAPDSRELVYDYIIDEINKFK